MVRHTRRAAAPERLHTVYSTVGNSVQTVDRLGPEHHSIITEETGEGTKCRQRPRYPRLERLGRCLEL